MGVSVTLIDHDFHEYPLFYRQYLLLLVVQEELEQLLLPLSQN